MATSRKPESDFLEFFLSDKNRKTCAFLGLDTFKKIKKYQKINREQEELRNEINYEINKVKITLSRTFVPTQKQSVQEVEVEIEVIPEKKENVKEKPESSFATKLDAKAEILKIKIYEKFVKCDWWSYFYDKFLDEIIFKNEVNRITSAGLNDQPEKKLFNEIIEEIDKQGFSQIIYHLTNPTEYSYAEIYKLIHLYGSTRDDAGVLIEFLRYKEFRDLLLSMKFYKKDHAKTEESKLKFLQDQLQKVDSYNLLVGFDSVLSELIRNYNPSKMNLVLKDDPLVDIIDPDKLAKKELIFDKSDPESVSDKKDWSRFASETAEFETDLFGIGHKKPEPTKILKEHNDMYMSLLNDDKTLLDKIIQFEGNNKELFFKLNKIESNLVNITEVFEHVKKNYPESENKKEKKIPVTIEKHTVEKELKRFLAMLNDDKELLEKILRSAKSGNKEKFFKENKIEKNLTDIIDVWDSIKPETTEYLNKLLELLGKQAIDIVPDVPVLTNFSSLSVGEKEKTAEMLWEVAVTESEKNPEFLALTDKEEQEKYLMKKMQESFESYFPVKKPEPE